VTNGVDRWTRPDSLQSVEGRVEGAALVLDLLTRCDVQEPDNSTLAFTLQHRICLPAGANWMVVEFVELTNTDFRPLDVRGVFFQPRSALGGSSEGDRPASVSGVPRLWASAPGDAWVDDESGFVWGAVAPRARGVAIHFWLNPHGGQHPDIRWRHKASLQPKETLKPDSPVYAILLGSDSGSKSWIAARREWSGWLSDDANATSAGLPNSP